MFSYERMPKISCLMVTSDGRFDYFKTSAQCYIDQTYPYKELVIVNEGSTEYQNQIKEFLIHRDDVKFVFLNGKYTLGALRNISIAMSDGEVFVQWDDDDFNMPERLAVQFSHLFKTNARFCYMSDQLHYYFHNNYLFWEDWGAYYSNGNKRTKLIPGTLMAWKQGFDYKYPSSGNKSRSGEDSVLSDHLCKDDSNVALLSGAGHLQVYTYHGQNVWNLKHHMIISTYRSKFANDMIKNKDKICSTIDYLKLKGTIKVFGREDLAFTHEAN